jgi:hypothetical protein
VEPRRLQDRQNKSADKRSENAKQDVARRKRLVKDKPDDEQAGAREGKWKKSPHVSLA